MALNFDKIISETENISLEDLPIESLVQTDLDYSFTAFNKLFEDHLANLINQNGNNKNKSDSVERGDIFDLDLECLGIEDNFDKNFDSIECLPPCYINLIDFTCNPTETDTYPDSDEIFSVNGSEEEPGNSNKKIDPVIRRQSTRIQNQIRKKIAEQIQRENIRLAKEAKRLNNNETASKNDIEPEEPLNSISNRYLSLPTDLDADDDNDVTYGEWKSDEDPNKLWCICKQPYGYRFMICCDICSEWYHGDCVGVTQEEGARMEENGQDFICPVCEKTSIKKDSKKIEPVVISDDDEGDDDNELLNEEGDDDCRIIKTVKPVKNNSNIFQIFKSSKSGENDSHKKPVSMTLSARTSVCLNSDCKTLINPKRSLYCSKKCIVKYVQMVKKNNRKEKVAQYGLVKGTKLAKITRFVVAQLETEKIETEENLKEFLFKNPTYKVFQSSASTKTKQDQLKSKEVNDSLTKSAVKRVKVVKHFAMIFKKTDQNEFRSIWQQCVNLEDSLFRMYEKTINQKYISKVKELLEIFKSKFENRTNFDVVKVKAFINDLLMKTTDQFKCKSVEIIEGKNNDKNDINKKSFNSTKTGISTLLSDTTHLHTQHLYDINCKICNGASKSNTNKKVTEKENPTKKIEDKPVKEKHHNNLEIDNIIPPIESCSPESLVTSWFNKSSEVIDLSPINLQNDEFKVTSTVETPDMAIDMELCSTPSASEHVDNHNLSNCKNIDSKVDSSSKIEITPNKLPHNKPVKQKLTSVWEGNIIYKEVGTVICKTYLVSRHHLGKSKDDTTMKTTGEKLRDEINLSVHFGSQIKINGRSKLSVIQDYLTKLRKHSNKEFLIFRLHPTNLEEGRKTYLKMFEFFHGKDRCGVIDQKKFGLKDCFIYPLNAHSKIPSFFLPLNGPGFERRRPHMLLMLVVRSPLEHNNLYKSFSPKYDQDHDFVKNHGINLEKYFKPPVNPSVCPSPISGQIPEEKANENIQVLEEEQSLSEIENIPSISEKEVPCDNEKQTEDEITSNKSDNQSITNEHDTSIKSKEISPYIDASSPNCETSVLENEKESDKGVVVNFEHIFNPTKLDENVIPFLSYPESHSNTFQKNNDNEHKYSDFDLRFISDDRSFINHPIKENHLSDFSTSNISSSQKRFYTFYDAYFNDPDYQTKRAKYFFNPRFPNNTKNSFE